MNSDHWLRRWAVAQRERAARLLRHAPGSSRLYGPPRRFLADTIAAAPAGTVRTLSPRRQVPRAMPTHADPTMADRLRGISSAVIKPRFVAELPRGRLWGRAYGYVIDADDALHGDVSPCFDDFNPDVRAVHDGLRQPWLPRVRRVAGTVAVLHTLFCENFHHWLLDAVPKLGLLREAGWRLDRIDWFTLPAVARQRWHRETFERLGLPEARILWTSASTHVEADCLLVPSYSEPGREPEKFDYTPEGLAFVRELFGDAPNAAPRARGPARIVVSRERTTARRWLAGDADRGRLAAAGFEKICLEDYSLAAQAALFRDARVIVMPTGGGLANLAHASPGARVVELFSPAYLPTFSVGLCAALGLEYHALVGDAAPGGTVHSDAGGARDIALSIETVLHHAL